MLSIGYAGCDEEGILEIDDEMSSDEIEIMIDDMAHEHANSWEGDSRLGWDDEMSKEEYEEECELFRENVEGSWRIATESDIENFS
jgi:hypothetical protein